MTLYLVIWCLAGHHCSSNFEVQKLDDYILNPSTNDCRKQAILHSDYEHNSRCLWIYDGKLSLVAP